VDILDFFRVGLTPRPKQVEAMKRIEAAFLAGKRIVVLEAPTGVGKSDVAFAFAEQARAMGQRTFMLTSQKILQDQYERDFPSPKLELIKGRNAYSCTNYRGKGLDCASNHAPCKAEAKSILSACADAPAGKVTDLSASPEEVHCEYWKALITAHRASVTCFNFSSFLYQQRLDRFDPRDLLIVDEAHNIEGQLMNFVELTLDERDLGVVMMSFDRNFDNAADVAKWVVETRLIGKISARIDEIAEELEVSLQMSVNRDIDMSLGPSAKLVGEKELLEKIQFKIELFMAMLPKTEWVTEVETRTNRKTKMIYRVLVARPVYARMFSEDLLFKWSKRALCCSATILSAKVWASNLGLKEKDVEFVQVGSDFPVGNRPIKCEYVGSMSWKDKEATIPRLVEWVKNVLLPRHKGQRGIIHAHSFSLAMAIMSGVRSKRLILHEDGVNKMDILFRHSQKKDAVILAPAFHEGIDLKDDLARFQAIVKVPYPSTQDKVVAIRMKDDKGWYEWQTMLKFCQSYGRSVRHKDDWAVTYVVDSGFESFYFRCSWLMPKWVKEAIVRGAIDSRK